MTTTEVFRVLNILLSLGATLYLVWIAVKNAKIRNLCVFPLTVTLDLLIKSIAILFFLPLDPDGVVFFNNWAFIANIHTLIMIVCMVFYFDIKEHTWKQ